MLDCATRIALLKIVEQDKRQASIYARCGDMKRAAEYRIKAQELEAKVRR